MDNNFLSRKSFLPFTTIFFWKKMKKRDKKVSGSNLGKNKVIIVSGTPGVGKSTVSKQLSSNLSCGLVSIGDLVKDEGLYTQVDRKRDTLVADMNQISKRINGIISNSSEMLIVEGHYAVDVVPLESVSLVFVLRRDPEELRDILRKRGYGEEKVRENVAAEILDVCLYDAVDRCGVEKICEVNVTGRTAEEVVNDVQQVLQGKKKHKIRTVDWLGKLNFEGKLDEYLKDF
jgi:adenylate kinase